MSRPQDVPPPQADPRRYGDDPEYRTDGFESFLLDVMNPRSNMRSGAHGFQIDQAKEAARKIRAACADGTLTALDLDLDPPELAP